MLVALSVKGSLTKRTTAGKSYVKELRSMSPQGDLKQVNISCGWLAYS